MILCPRCGAENPQGSELCSRCSAPLAAQRAASPAAHQPPPTTPPPSGAPEAESIDARVPAAAPTAVRAQPRRGRGGLIALIIVAFVVLAGAVAGLYYHTKVAPRRAAQAYLAASLSNDVDALRGLLTRAAAEQLPTKEEAEEEKRRMEAAFPEAAQMMRQLRQNVKQEVTGISGGLNEAKADVQVRISAFGQHTTRSYTLFLVREGIAWKVDLERTGQGLLNASPAE